jgi:hypothetical protein
LDSSASSSSSSSSARFSGGAGVGLDRDVEAGPVGGDRLEAHVPAAGRGGDLAADVLAQLVEPESAGDALLGDPLDAHDRRAPAAGELAHALEARALPGHREAVVEEQPLGPRRAQQRGRVLVGVGRRAVLVHRRLGRVAAEQRGQRVDRPPVRHAGRDVRPLARVRALGEQAAELVERRRRRDDPVRVVVDQGDVVQYFEKWPRCSNASSSAA